MTSWWPWHGSGDTSPSPDPAPDERVELTPLGLKVSWQARVDQVDAILAEALRQYGNGHVPADVLLDIRLALHPVKLRPEVPGTDRARRA